MGSGNVAKLITTKEFEREVRDLGITHRTLTFYRERGLIPPVILLSKGRYGMRGYHKPSTVERVKVIRRLQGEGYSLREIARLLDAETAKAEDAARTADAEWLAAAHLDAPVEGEFLPPQPKMKEVLP